MRVLVALSVAILFLLGHANIQAMPSVTSIPTFSATHGAQGTGNYKGKRDKHEKPGPMNERKKKGGKWKWLRR